MRRAYLIAPKRHPGGPAAASWAETAKRARKSVDLAAIMLKAFSVLNVVIGRTGEVPEEIELDVRDTRDEEAEAMLKSDCGQSKRQNEQKGVWLVVLAVCFLLC